MSQIREEFEKDFEKEQKILEPLLPGATLFMQKEVALWAAKWMAERCAKTCDSFSSLGSGTITGDACRQLSKDLDS